MRNRSTLHLVVYFSRPQRQKSTVYICDKMWSIKEVARCGVLKVSRGVSVDDIRYTSNIWHVLIR